MTWNVITAIATVISTAAYILTAVYIRAELKALDKERYLAVTSELFSLWQSKDFMEAQLWLLHKMDETTWESFVQAHRGDYGECSFHRVGSFYDRVGTLVRMGLIDDKEILSTIGAYAIAVWQKMEPLVQEARRVENSVLFDDFEMLLPSCYECYVPSLGENADVRPFSLSQPAVNQERPDQPPADGPSSTPPARPVARPAKPLQGSADGKSYRTSLKELKRHIDRKDAVTVLDARRSDQVLQVPLKLPQAVWMPINDMESNYRQLPPGQEIIVYCA